MFVLIIHIIKMIRTQKNRVFAHNQSINRHQPDRRNHNQMFILMITNVSIFLVTTLPLIMSNIISLHTVKSPVDISNSLTIITILGWFQQLNCSVSFSCMIKLRVRSLALD